MNRMMLFLCLLVLSGTLVSCGVGLEDSSTGDTARQIKNGKLREEYDSVKGTYEGFIRLNGSARRFPVKVYLFWGEVQEQPLPGDLKPGIRVVLRGRLMQSQFVGDSDNLILSGQFDSITGRLTLDPDENISKTSTGCRLGGQDPISLNGQVNGDTLSALVLRNGQEWAQLEDMTRVSRDISTGAVLSEEQEYRRLQQIYAPVAGMYRGELERPSCDNKTRKEGFELWLYIERVQEGVGLNGAPCFVPRLVARSLRYYSGSFADVSYRSINRFDPESFLPQFQSIATGVEMNLFPGTKSDSLQGELSTTGQWGSFEVKRFSTEVQAPESETTLLRQRLLRTYSLFTGFYAGQVKPYEKGAKNWPVDLNLYTDEAVFDGALLPVLMARYRRLDNNDPDSIGSRLMSVSLIFDGCKPTLSMKSESSGGGPGKPPGVGLMRFTADFINNSMSGELVDHRGPQGVMTITK
jgi:hypothetical protein